MVVTLLTLAGGAVLTTMVVPDATFARVELRLYASSIPIARAILPSRVPGASIHVDIDGDGLFVRIDATPERLPDALDAAVQAILRPHRRPARAACLRRARDVDFSPDGFHDRLVQRATAGLSEDCRDARRVAMRRAGAALASAPLAAVAVGNVDAGEVLAHLAPLGPHANWRAPAARGVPDCSESERFPGATRSRVTLAWASAGADDALRDAVLADGYSSRVSTRLRQEVGLVYAVTYARSGGVATATAEAEPGKEGVVEFEMRQELLRALSPADIEIAQTRLAARVASAGDSVASLADNLWNPPGVIPSAAPATLCGVVTTGQ